MLPMKKIFTIAIILFAVLIFSCDEIENGEPKETVAEPTAAPNSGTALDAGDTVELFCETDGASIHYTINGGNPTSASALYNAPIVINSNTTIRVIAIKSGMNNSEIKTFSYTIKPLPQVIKPTAEPVSGTLLELGDTIELFCETDGASIYYTIDGSNPSTSSFLYTDPIEINTSNDSITIKAIAVKSEMTTSDIITATYPINQPLFISLGGVTGKLIPGTANILIENYTDPANIATFTIPDGAFKTAITGKDITVDIQGPANSTISLAYVHYLRQALQGTTAAPLAGNVDINSALIPEFDGKDWWAHGLVERDLYSFYPKNTDTTLINGIKISHNSTNDKYIVVYDGDLRVSRPVWQNSNTGAEAPFHGFGLKQDTGGNILLNDGNIIVFGGRDGEENNNDNRYPVVADWTVYDAALKTAGLHPSQNDASGNPIRLDHSRVRVNGVTGSNNILANGMYDFVLRYYNPAPTGSGGIDFRNLLPIWFVSGGNPMVLTFDGYAKDGNGYIKENGRYTPALPDGVASRNIGGIDRASPDRKALTDGGGLRRDEPREDFIGSVTYPMAKYMVDRLGINEFHNTNIIGDHQQIGNVLYRNVAFIGDHSSLNDFSIKSEGVIDIKGSLPRRIMTSSAVARYLNIWSNVSRETNAFSFPVVVIRGSGGESVTTGSGGAPGSEARVIIYHNKYNAAPLNTTGVQPHHRAFMVGGVPKFTGGSIPSVNGAWYRGSTPGNAIPNLDENAWIDFANNGGAVPANLA
ncbi:MAG: chitobiase/beta-hexosaminidase C-terminal domain-containing protein, partial [Treponema sp.]|nr:chitobiase/beta-hexosaminidase C-terminal domain-containing protein [Treponema sp.]